MICARRAWRRALVQTAARVPSRSLDLALEVGRVDATDLVGSVVADADAKVVHQGRQAGAIDQDDALADAADILAGIVGEARLAPGDQRAVEAGRRR